MKSQSPQVSIGMPLYNAERYLRNALDALLGQTFEDFELVISDNASGDATEAICREYAQRDSRVKYHRSASNHGAIWNFNEVFRLSTGQYFKWSAYDDIVDESFLQKCVDCLNAHSDVAWCHSRTSHLDESGNVIAAGDDPTIPGMETSHSLLLQDYGLPPQTRASPTAHKRFTGVLLGTTWCSDSYGLIRSEVLRRTRLLLPCYGAEKVLMGEISLQGRFVEIPEVLAYERIHSEASGALLSSAAQQTFVIGFEASRFSSTRWALLKGHAGAILHASLTWRQRLRCAGSLLRYVLQVQKWKRIVTQALAGVGIGAETRTEYETRELGRSTAKT